jgi:hypothetical protein
MTEVEAQKLVTILMASFSTKGIQDPAATQAIYRRMISDLDYQVASAAVERLLATSEFMPTIAAIRSACVNVTQGDKRAGGEAWGDVLRAVGKFGYMRQPGQDFNLEDNVAQRAVLALGWRNICESENQIADRARFVDLYDKLSASNRTEQIAGSLPAQQRLRELRAGEAQSLSQIINGVKNLAGDSVSENKGAA